MKTDHFVDAVAPGDLYAALEPAGPPAGPAACARHDPTRFESAQRQRAAFDGTPADPATDYPAARAMCLSCSLLVACREYADASREGFSFLAGLTAAERRARHSKRSEIVKRRRQVRALRTLGAPNGVIADLLGRHPSLISADVRASDQVGGTAA